MEALQDQAKNAAKAVGNLLALLVDKGVLTLDDVNQVVSPLYEFEEEQYLCSKASQENIPTNISWTL